ncbi:hypothetical protein C2S52_000753 [Perilla frutescens var. hirtella]|nr:hypothetical protein C2S52_000753 [Perilla frutescens var. hirtella]
MVALVRTDLTFLVLNRTSNYVNVWRSPFSLRFFSAATIFDTLRNKYDFPRALASRAASELSRSKNPEKAEAVLSFFESSGFSNAQLQKILKYQPRFLSSSLDDTIRPKIKFFQDEGFSSADITKIISSNPRILKSSLNNSIIPSLAVMKGLLGSNIAVAKVVRAQPSFVSWNMKTTVVPNVEFLKSCGVPMDRIRLAFRSCPTSFQAKPEVMSRSADKAKSMGIDAASNAFVYAVSTIISFSKESWELKLQGFRDMGFSDSDISTMFRKAPSVFCVSMEKIKKIKELLLATGKFNILSIANYPTSLTYSFEKRYEPRLRVLTFLEKRKLIKCWPTLPTISQTPDDEFFELFIRPYSNKVSDVYFRNRYVGCKKGVKHALEA